MRRNLILAAAIVLVAVSSVANAGGQRVLLVQDNCNQFSAVRSQRVIVQRQRFSQPVILRQSSGGSLFVRERSIGPFGIFGRSRTIIRN